MVRGTGETSYTAGSTRDQSIKTQLAKMSFEVFVFDRTADVFFVLFFVFKYRTSYATTAHENVVRYIGLFLPSDRRDLLERIGTGLGKMSTNYPAQGKPYRHNTTPGKSKPYSVAVVVGSRRNNVHEKIGDVQMSAHVGQIIDPRSMI